MAKRREEEESNSSSWYDQPLYETDEDEGDLFRDIEADMEADKKRRKPRRSGGRVGVVGGCFKVILTAILAIITFALLGVGIAVGGRAAGILPLSSATFDTTETAPEAEVAAVIEPTPTLSCDPQAWWNAQAATFDTFNTAYDRVTLAPAPETLDAVVSDLQARQTALLGAPDAPCVTAARDIFSAAMTTTITSVQSIVSNDRTGASITSGNASRALSNTLVAFWDLDVATDPNTPPILDVPRNSCDVAELDAWYTPFRQQWEQANPIISQMDMTAFPELIEDAVASLEIVRGNLMATPAPACADRARQLTIIALNSYINAVNSSLQGNVDAARESASTYARSHVVLNAWLVWLGVEMV